MLNILTNFQVDAVGLHSRDEKYTITLADAAGPRVNCVDVPVDQAVATLAILIHRLRERGEEFTINCLNQGEGVIPPCPEDELVTKLLGPWQ